MSAPVFQKRDFEAGYLIAVANIMHSHDNPVIAADVLGELSDDPAILDGLDLSDFDLEPLRQLFADLRGEQA